jgi:hypothetical protein
VETVRAQRTQAPSAAAQVFPLSDNRSDGAHWFAAPAKLLVDE